MAKPIDPFPSQTANAAADRNRKADIDSYLVCAECRSWGFDEPFHFGILKVITVGAVNTNDVEWFIDDQTCPQCGALRRTERFLHEPSGKMKGLIEKAKHVNPN
jgi:hypothetical protein